MTQPCSSMILAASVIVTPREYPASLPSTTTKTSVPSFFAPTRVRGWLPWIEWLPKFVSISTSSIPSTIFPFLTSDGPKDRVFHTPSLTSFWPFVLVSS